MVSNHGNTSSVVSNNSNLSNIISGRPDANKSVALPQNNTG